MYCFKCEKEITNGFVCSVCGNTLENKISFLFPVVSVKLDVKAGALPKTQRSVGVNSYVQNLKVKSETLDEKVVRLSRKAAALKMENASLKSRKENQQKKLDALRSKKEEIEKLIGSVY